MQAGRTPSLEHELSAAAAGRLAAAEAAARAGRRAQTLRLSAPGLAAGEGRSRDESQEALPVVPRGKAHGAPAQRAQARVGNQSPDDATRRDQPKVVTGLRGRRTERRAADARINVGTLLLGRLPLPRPRAFGA